MKTDMNKHICTKNRKKQENDGLIVFHPMFCPLWCCRLQKHAASAIGVVTVCSRFASSAPDFEAGIRWRVEWKPALEEVACYHLLPVVLIY